MHKEPKSPRMPVFWLVPRDAFKTAPYKQGKLSLQNNFATVLQYTLQYILYKSYENTATHANSRLLASIWKKPFSTSLFMTRVVNICILGAGMCTSLMCSRKKVPLSVGIIATSSLFYAGSMLEFNNLVTAQPLSRKSCGYWMLKGGVFGAGMITGSLVSSVLGCL